MTRVPEMQTIENNIVSALIKDGPAITIEESLRRASRLVSSHSGIISEVAFEELRPGDPPIYWSTSTPSDVSIVSGLNALNRGWATSIDPDRATIKSIGESVERYCSAHYDKENLLLSTFDKCKFDAVPLKEFVLFSEKQLQDPDFHFAGVGNDIPIRWARGTSLVSGQEKYDPAGFMYVPYEYERPEEPTLNHSVSTGLACAPSLASAVCKGILEVVERDALMITWHNKISPAFLGIWSVDDPLVQNLLQPLKDLPYKIDTVYLTLDIDIPVILIILSSETGNSPLTLVGLGCDLNPTRAVTLALEEVYLGILGIGKFVRKETDFVPEADYSNVEDLNMHGLAHAICPELKESMSFLVQRDSVIDFKDIPNRANESMVKNISTMVDMLKKKDMDVIYADLTTIDIEDCGFKVVRVIVPGMIPLDIHHLKRHLGEQRIYQVPVQMGLFSKALTEEELNSFPHPFP